MKKFLLLFVLNALLLTQAYAANNSPWYMGIKGGIMDANGMSDSALNLGFDLGYRHNRYLSTEVELTETIVDGDTPSGNDWDVETLSVFAAVRTDTTVKLKAKVGLTNINYGGNSDTELSFGVGLGFWAGGGLMEIEYTEIDDGLEYISLGVNYFF